jgi:hypothetical protein
VACVCLAAVVEARKSHAHNDRWCVGARAVSNECKMTGGDTYRSVTLGCSGTIRNVKDIEGHKKIALIPC